MRHDGWKRSSDARFRSWTLPAAIAIGLCPVWAASAADREGLEGIWKGMLVGKPAEVEADILFEIGRTPEGELAGTFDMPVQDYKFFPLETIQLDGSSVTLDFHRDSETRGAGAYFLFEGELSEDGNEIKGHLTAEAVYPFYVTWTAEAGTPRDEPYIPPIEPLSPQGDQLRQAFNRDQDYLRLIITLSPT